MKHVRGNILNCKEKIIVHGCNCFCTMGAGVAVAIAQRFPKTRIVDNQTKSGDYKKLGTYSVAYDSKTIINAYTQYSVGRGLQLNYSALRRVFRQINKDFVGQEIAIPRIGAGLAGGDWDKIEKIIDEETPDVTITCYSL